MFSTDTGSLRWHPECFNCSICGELLEHVSSYERDGKMYCHLDYHEVRAILPGVACWLNPVLEICTLLRSLLHAYH